MRHIRSSLYICVSSKGLRNGRRKSPGLDRMKRAVAINKEEYFYVPITCQNREQLSSSE